jgi:hypothetical protein
LLFMQVHGTLCSHGFCLACLCCCCTVHVFDDGVDRSTLLAAIHIHVWSALTLVQCGCRWMTRAECL